MPLTNEQAHVKLTFLHPFPSSRLALASLLVLNAAACLAAAPGPDPTPEVPEVKTTDQVTIIKHGNVVINIGGRRAAASPGAWCGVSLSEAPAEVRAQLPLEEGVGVLVRDVVTDSPAQKAGVQVNDVLTKFNDQKINDPLQFSQLVAAQKKGEAVRLTYFRHGREAATEVTLAQPPPEEASGLALQTLQNLKQTLNGDGKILAAENDETLAQIEKSLQASNWNPEAIEQFKKDIARAMAEAQRSLSIEVKQE